MQPDTERDSAGNNFIIYRPSTPDNSSGNFDDLIGSLDGGDILSEDDKNLPMSGSVIISSPGDLPDFNNPGKVNQERFYCIQYTYHKITFYQRWTNMIGL